MTDYLIIRLTHDDLAEWLVVDDEGSRKSATGRGSLEEAAAAADGKKCIVLVPSLDVITLSTDLPARGNRLLAALPYALEDQVADDVESQHFAPGKRDESGNLPVAVIAKDQLDRHLERLEDAGIQAARLVPEYHGLVEVPNTLSLLIEGDLIMFNDGRGLKVALSGASPSELIASAGYIGTDDADAPRSLVVYCDESARDRFDNDFNALRHELDSVDVHVLSDGALPRLAIAVAGGQGVNLLQGRYGEKTEARTLLKPWKTAAILLVGVILVSVVGRVADYIRLGDEEAALKAQFTELYRDLRPNDQREILDPLGTVRSLERTLGTGTSAVPVFLPSMQAVAAAIQANGSVEIEAVSYRAGVIDIRLTVPDVATLDRIQQAVNSTNRFVATIQSTTQASEGVDSRLQIREAGA